MTPLSEETLGRLAEVVHRHLGLHFPPERWRDLTRGVEATCRDLGEPGVEACTGKLLSGALGRHHLEVLGRNLTVGETYFFREEAAFTALETRFLPELLARRRQEGRILRFWSAACATGEEPYSLAILLHSQIPDIERWNATVLATDINTEFLRKAETAIYREWSFRTDRGRLRERWFTRTEGGQYQVRPEIRRLVTFAFHNLAEDPYPSLANHTNAMDVIFCRNVLMYFSEERRRQVLANLHRCLVDGGFLILGAAETSTRPGPGLVPVVLPDLIVYQRQPAPAAAAARPPQPPSAMRPETPPARPRPPAEPPATLLAVLDTAFRRGDYAEACRLGSGLAGGDPEFAAAALLVARACANLGNLQEAWAWVEKVIARHRLDPDAHYLGAMILDEQGRTSEALDALRTTLFLDPDFVPAYVALGNIHRRQGERRQADRNFRNALILLERFADDETVPHAEEMRAGRLREAVIAAMGGNDA